MALRRPLFPFTMLNVLSFISCYTVVSASPSHELVKEAYGNDFEAKPSHVSTIGDGKLELGSTIFRLKKVDGVGSCKLGASVKTLNVDDFGAKGGGTDDTEAFNEAWKAACSSAGAAVLVVPKKKYVIGPTTFTGPCKSSLTVQIYGSIEASADRSEYMKDGRHWLSFDGVLNLRVEGGGIINGNGQIWWQHSCKINKKLPCKDAPTALTFYNCKNIVVHNLKIQDAQQIHVSFEKCVNVGVSNLMVTSSEMSPNTDGIHVTDTQNIQIRSCVIGTGDDCISIVSGSQKVLATDITCGPGHGISIGSLGSGNSKAYVSDVVVNGAKLYGTTNGLRIKTWQGGSGSASNIKFQNVEFHDVTNPIIIDQNYCDREGPCKEQTSAVQVKDVMYQNIKGTSASDVAINFDCSKSFPCLGIVLQNVDIESGGSEAAKAICNGVKPNKIGLVSPDCP